MSKSQWLSLLSVSCIMHCILSHSSEVENSMEVKKYHSLRKHEIDIIMISAAVLNRHCSLSFPPIIL